MFLWGRFISLVENSSSGKRKDHKHRVTDDKSHKPRKGSPGTVDGWLGGRRLGRQEGAHHGSELTEPAPTPPPSISTQQRNMTMLAFFISLTLPLIKQWSKRGFAESVLYAPITHDEIISHRIVLKLNDDKNALLFCVHQFMEVYQVINVSWQTARWIQE